jgi:hypothetical protein
MILLFGAGNLNILHTQGKVIVDNFIEFEISAQTAVHLKTFRQQVENMLHDKISDPELKMSEQSQKLVDAVVALLEDSPKK